jgi:putative transcriptional regulator
MAIKCKLSTLMGENRYNMGYVHEKTGLSRTTISNLYHDRMERIDYTTLSKLCELFNCSTSDILEYHKEEK